MPTYFPDPNGIAQECTVCRGPILDLISVSHPRHRSAEELFESNVPITDGICIDCSLVQRSPMPSEQELADYYTGESLDFGDFVLFSTPQDEQFRRNQASWICGNLRRSGACVLDVGAFNGRLLGEIVSRGVDAYGIDVSFPLEYVDGRAQGRMFRGILNDEFRLPSPIKPITAIVASHVLEHTAHPVRFLELCARIVGNEGQIFVEVPNVLGANFRDFTPFSSLEHTYNFSPSSLASVAFRAGLTPNKIETVEGEPVVGSVIRAVFSVGSSEDVAPATTPADIGHVVQTVVRNRQARESRRNRAASIVGSAADKQICIFGAGIAGYRVLELLQSVGGRVVAFVDSDARKVGKAIQSIPVFSPGHLQDFDGAVVIASFAYSEEISEQLAEINNTLAVYGFFEETQ